MSLPQLRLVEVTHLSRYDITSPIGRTHHVLHDPRVIQSSLTLSHAATALQPFAPQHQAPSRPRFGSATDSDNPIHGQWASIPQPASASPSSGRAGSSGGGGSNAGTRAADSSTGVETACGDDTWLWQRRLASQAAFRQYLEQLLAAGAQGRPASGSTQQLQQQQLMYQLLHHHTRCGSSGGSSRDSSCITTHGVDPPADAVGHQHVSAAAAAACRKVSPLLVGGHTGASAAWTCTADTATQASFDPVERSRFRTFTDNLCQITLSRCGQLSAPNTGQVCYSLGALNIRNQPELVTALSRHSYHLMALTSPTSRGSSRQLPAKAETGSWTLNDPWGYDGDPTDPFADFRSSGGRSTGVHRVSPTGEGTEDGTSASYGDDTSGHGDDSPLSSGGLFDDSPTLDPTGPGAYLSDHGSNAAGGASSEALRMTTGASGGGVLVPESGAAAGAAAAFGPSDLADLAWGLASVSFQPSAAWLDRFCKTSSPLLELMLPSQLWGVLWGLASCSHTPPEAWMDRFLGRCEAVMGDLDAPSLTRIVWSLGRLRYVPSRSWLRAAAGMSVSEGLLRTYEPAHVVDLVEGLAAMGYKPREQITYAIMAVVQRQMRSLAPQQLCTLMFAMASLSRWRPYRALLFDFASSLQRLAPSLTATQACQVLWAFATFKYLPDPRVTGPLLAQVQTYASQASPSSLSMCLWALGVFKLQPGQAWLDAWQASAIRRLDAFAAPDLAYSLQGFSELDTPPSGAFMRASLAAVSARLPTLSCPELSAVAAALADLRYRPPDAWLLPFAGEARARLPGFELGHLGPLVYGMASLGAPLDEDWLEAFGRECVRKLGASREGASLGLMLWGMAMYGFVPDARKWWAPFYRETDRSWDLCTGKSLVLMAVALGSLEGSMGRADAPTAIWRRSLVKGLRLRLTKPDSSAGVPAAFLVSAASQSAAREALHISLCAAPASTACFACTLMPTRSTCGQSTAAGGSVVPLAFPPAAGQHFADEGRGRGGSPHTVLQRDAGGLDITDLPESQWLQLVMMQLTQAWGLAYAT
ncbi:MAG: hypothetical protein WDW36_007336 [Sanguina aurantia]